MVKLRKELAPIVVFGYNRPHHLKQTLEALSNNDLASESELYIFLDAPKSVADEMNCKQVHAVSTNFKWKGYSKKIITRPSNFGLAKNITEGVSEILNNHSSVIVLEDDIVTSKGFLKYMNDALQFYEDESQVMHIAGYMHPIKLSDKQKTYFYQVTSCWGWATWTDRWKYYEDDAIVLYKELESKGLIDWFDLDTSGVFLNQLKRNISGELNSWAIKWQASVNLRNGLSLHPCNSLVRNIGFDNSGENCTENQYLIQQELIDSIEVSKISLHYSSRLRNKMKNYYSRKSHFRNIILKLKNRFNRLNSGSEKWHKIKTGEAKDKFLYLNPKSFHAWQKMIDGRYDSFWIDRIRTLNIRPSCIIDVGAHFGYHTITLASIFEDAKIISIEPNPVNAKRLNKNVAKNKIQSVKIHTVALSDEAGELEFSISDNIESSQSTGSYLSKVKPPLSEEHYSSFKLTKVKSLTLDELCRENGYKPDLIKIDVEGAELLTLKGATLTLREFKPLLFIEAHSFSLEKQIFSLLPNYDIEVLDRDNDRSFLFCTPK